MEREDGYTFDCRIPPFSLESKPDGGSATPPDNVWFITVNIRIK